MLTFVFLNLLDLLTTRWGLAALSGDLNPIVASLTWRQLILAKVGLLAYVLVTHALMARYWPRLARWYRIVLVWIYLVVVAWNIRSILL